MMRANPERSASASFRTRAVMPTLVAASIAPRKAWSIHDSSGRASSPTPNPSSIGVMTPTTATRAARASDGQHLLRRRFEAHVEQQQDGAQLREDGEGLAGYEARGVGSTEEHHVAEDDADQQLAQDRRLAEAFEELSCELRGDEHEGQGQEDDGYRVRSMSGPGSGERQQRYAKESPSVSHRPAHVTTGGQ